ncbi:MAG TPA: NAD(P)-dependent oxidoreductase [Geobacteraceae bacterium]
MKVLVTGATGFVGSCLARRLVETGHEVHVFSRQGSDRWRLAGLEGRLADHRVDLRDGAAVMAAVAMIRPAAICHLATHGGFAFQQETSVILESNFLGTVNLLRACEKVGFDSFINTGSSSEYGVKGAPMREGDLLEPVGDYGVSKAAATLFCRSEALQKGLPVVTLRLFSPYGPWDDPKRFIPYAIKSLLRGEPPQLSNPASVRDYVYIDDVLDLYLKLIGEPRCGGEVFNAASGRQSSIGEVFSLLAEIIDPGVTPVWGAVGSRRPEPPSWVADIGRAERELGWKPAVSLRDGLAKTSGWMREHLAYYP